MKKVDCIVSEELLEEITGIIVREADPRMIILFGSYATGNESAGSDMDFLVVEDGPFNRQRSRRAEMIKLWRALRSFRIAKDFLVYTPEEIAQWESVRNHVVFNAMRDGRVLYERR